MNDRELLGWPTWIGVVVENLDTERRFWGELLGLPEDYSTEDSVTFMTADGRWFELIERSEDAEYNEPRFQVAFAVDDIKATYEQLVQRGVEAITPIYGDDEPWASATLKAASSRSSNDRTLALRDETDIQRRSPTRRLP